MNNSLLIFEKYENHLVGIFSHRIHLFIYTTIYILKIKYI